MGRVLRAVRQNKGEGGFSRAQVGLASGGRGRGGIGFWWLWARAGLLRLGDHVVLEMANNNVARGLVTRVMGMLRQSYWNQRAQV